MSTQKCTLNNACNSLGAMIVQPLLLLFSISAPDIIEKSLESNNDFFFWINNLRRFTLESVHSLALVLYCIGACAGLTASV